MRNFGREWYNGCKIAGLEIMPELPEVETIVRKLQRGEPVERGLPSYPTPVGHAITGVWIDWPRVAYPSVEAIARRLPGHCIASIGRRGKYIIFTLSTGAGQDGAPADGASTDGASIDGPSIDGAANALLIHLKMSGRLDVLTSDTPRSKHVHVVFALDNGY